MSKKIRIRFSGLAALGTPNKQMIETMSGYSLFQDGNDWVVYDDDPRFNAPPTRYLDLHPDGIPLQANSYAQAADDCIAYLNPTFEQKALSSPKDLKISNNLGPLSDLEYVRNAFFWGDTKILRQRMVAEIFPRMASLGAERVYPVTLDATAFYRAIALPKASYLNRKHGLVVARDKILNDRVLDAALPTPLDPLNSLDVLLFAPPYAIAIPLHRVGSELLFTTRRAWQFPTILTANAFDLMDSPIEPFSTNTLDAILFNEDVSRWIIGAYLNLAVLSINNMTNFLCNPLNFLDGNGEFDELRLLKANSLFRLLVADAKAINMTGSFHGKARLVFQFIDKLANLSVEMAHPGLVGQRRKLETDATDRFYNLNYFEELKKILRHHGRKQERKLGDALVKIVTRIESKCRADIAGVFKKVGRKMSDEDVVSYFRILRNLGHGTYLNRDQFEKLFLELNPVIPTEFTYLPWLTLLALGLAPERVLGMP